MLKKTITYTDWNGKSRTEDFYFNLTRTECIELEYQVGNKTSLSDTLATLIETQDGGAIIRIIKDIILKAYGEKSEDGRRFVKNQDVRDAFTQCAAFDELYMSLATNAEEAATFLSGIMPTEVTKELGDNPTQTLMDRMEDYSKTGQFKLTD